MYSMYLRHQTIIIMIWILLLINIGIVQSQCENGTQLNGSTGKCEACLPGYYQIINVGNKCISCEPGKYQNQSQQTSCESCIVGQYQNQFTATTCFTCPETTNEGYCVEQRLVCPTGRFMGRQSNHCTNCTAGLFSNITGTTACESCQQGKYQPLEGQSSCEACPEQTESNKTSCTNCSSLWVKHSFTCAVNCPTKTYNNSGICEVCPRGTYLNNTACTDCPSGFIKESDGPWDCTQCPPNYVSFVNQTCQQCGNHTQVDNNECKCKQSFKLENESCVKCNSTEYQNEIGQSSCKACPTNQVSGDGNECAFCPSTKGYINGSCETCVTGQVQENTGTCTECSTGKYATDNRCADCLIGAYQNEQGQTECKYCSNGQYQNATGQANCKNCSGSTPQTNLIGKGSTFCCAENVCDTDKCGPGRDRTSSNCTKCAVGRWSTQNSNCQDCPKGYIAPEEESHKCSMCPDGQTSNTALTGCIACPPGQYEEGYECKSCPRGYFSDTNGTTSCNKCPFVDSQPQTTVNNEQKNDSNCKICNQSKDTHLVINADGICSQCAAGKYVNNHECKDCPIGKYTDQPHEKDCKPCESGRTTGKSGASSCVFCTDNNCNCVPGQYGSSCATCPIGWWSMGGEKCNACSQRTYQDQEGQANCKNCAAGKYSDEIGLGKCKPCAAGSFQNKDTQGSCFDCPIGRYSLQGEDNECDKCPHGTTTETENSDSQSSCKKCTAGKYELNGICNDCQESFYQDEIGQYHNETTPGCKSCPTDQWSEPGSNSSADCFSTGKLTTYTFGNMKDQTRSSAFETTCEIRPNFVLLCPACTCNSDSRNGFWDGPVCDECQRGFASRYCTSICPGYNGKDDSTICNGNGRCWFGRFGNGLCYCGGNHVIDKTAENAFVDVRTCPRGQICPGYGSSSVETASYIPQYYIIQYRQFTTFVLQISKYTPERGHMWFKRFPPSKAYENSCSVCTSKYTASLMTEVGYWAKDGEYKTFPPQVQTNNGFHGENCQHECAVCLNNGYCVHSPHPFHYSYTIKDTFMEKGRVIVPTTSCICKASVFDASHMCCPNGFQPYVYYGAKHTDPYSRFDTVPFITSIDNDQSLPYHRDRDLWLYSNNNKPEYPPKYYEPQNGMLQVAIRKKIENQNYHTTGPYNKHVYHGTTREICRACPGLFGKGIRAQEIQIQTEQEAEDYWWSFSASSGDKKCANQGVCDFYAKERENDFDFMGDVATWSLLHRGVLCRSDTIKFDADTLAECVTKALENKDKFVGWGEEFYRGGSGYNATSTKPAEDYAKKGTTYYEINGVLPPPDSDSEFEIYPTFTTRCYGFKTCNSFTNDSYAYNIYDITRGRADDRFSRTIDKIVVDKSSHDRFDTCFTFTKDNNRAQFDLFISKDYNQGLDPFIGGDCPRGYFCTQTDKDKVFVPSPPVGYKEACPPGYFQPKYRMTRKDKNIRCNRGRHDSTYEITNIFCADTTDEYIQGRLHQLTDAAECKAVAANFFNSTLRFNSSVSDVNKPQGCFKEGNELFYNNETDAQTNCAQCVCRYSNPCQLNTATFQRNDYVDKICQRCPRHKWAAEGSYECNECPKGTIKKISGDFDTGKVLVFNMDTIQNDLWYYIPNEQGTEQADCAKVPPSVVHIPDLNIKMEESSQDQQFLPVITCPYGFSNRPGTYVIQDRWDLNLMNKNLAFTLPPYVTNVGVESGIVSDIPCECIADDTENGINYFTPPTIEKCWEYARIQNTLKKCTRKEDKEMECADTGTGVNAQYMDQHNIFWKGCSKFENSATVHYKYLPNQVKNTPSGLQFICIKKVTNTQLTKQIAAQYCFTCPGDSITGPDSGVCSTCPGNMVKKNMKLAIQKLVERSYPRLYQCYSSRGIVKDKRVRNNTVNPPTDELITCDDEVKLANQTELDIDYKEENIQAWQFIIDENTLWKVDSVFWRIKESKDKEPRKLTLSDCILACSTTWGSEQNSNRKVRIGIAVEQAHRNFCLCNDGGSTEAYYRYVGDKVPDVARQAKYKKTYEIDTTQCDDITNPHDCAYAARQLGYQLSFDNSISAITDPRGCYKSGNKIKFNPTGTESCSDGCVCVNKASPEWKKVGSVHVGPPLLQEPDQGNQAERESWATKHNAMFFQVTGGKIYAYGAIADTGNAGESGNNTWMAQWNTPVQSTTEKILWYQSQVEDEWNKIRPLCGTCSPGEKISGSKCEKCTPGQYTSTPEEATQELCQNCPEGYSQNSHGKSYCSQCMAGLAQNAQKGLTCKECQVGYYENDKGMGIGLVTDGDKIQCKECPNGWFQADTGSTSCKECPKGKYGNEVAKSSCKECPQGWFQDNIGRQTCTRCHKGRHNSQTSQPLCKECIPGKFESSLGSTLSYCKECEIGKYQNEVAGTICKDCQPSGTTEKPDGNPYGYQDDRGGTNCKACEGGHTCTGSAIQTCPAGSVNAKQPNTIFTPLCTECTDRDAANTEATKCVPCDAPKKRPSSSGIECTTCPNGWHSVITSSEGRPVCTQCKSSEKIVSGGCEECGQGTIMNAKDDQSCSKCTKPNEVGINGVCTPCPTGKKPNSEQTACEDCTGKGWNEMFSMLGKYPSDNGYKFSSSVSHSKYQDCKSDGPGPQVICYAAWEIEFTELTLQLCFTATDVDDQVALYLKPIGTGIGFPAYFDKSGCGCHAGGGCACMTDYPFLMDYDALWGKANSAQWSWWYGRTGKRCMLPLDIRPNKKMLLVMWFFNEDEYSNMGGVKLSTTNNFRTGYTCP